MDASLASFIVVPSHTEVVIRLGLAVVAGMLIGLERETHGRAAGFRTTTIVCLAAALSMIISEVAFVEAMDTSSSWRPDPMRLAAGLLAGMGFLGAGAIVRNKNIVRGITTAATLWFSTILGLCFGGGMFFIGAIGLIAVLFVLVMLPGVESRINNSRYVWLVVTMNADAMSEKTLKELLHSLGLIINAMELDYDFIKRQKIVSCEITLRKFEEFGLSEQIISLLSQKPGVQSVALRA